MSTINGKLIREKRKAMVPSLTQEGLAREAGVTLQTIWNLEKDNGGGARVDTLGAVARALGCTVDDLIVD